MQTESKKKLRILLGLFLAIACFVVVMYSQIPTIPDIKLETSSFYDEVVGDVNRQIPSDAKSFKPVSSYSHIANVIEVEFILGKINAEQKETCFKYAQTAVVECVKHASASVINSGKWNSQNMSEVYNNCGIAIGLRFCPSADKPVLTRYRNIVTNYRDAMDVISSSHTFINVERSKQLIESAKKYLADENMKRCGELITALNTVKPSLYKAHLENVKNTLSKSGISNLEANKTIDKFVANRIIYDKPQKEVEDDVKELRNSIKHSSNINKGSSSDASSKRAPLPTVNDDVW